MRGRADDVDPARRLCATEAFTVSAQALVHPRWWSRRDRDLAVLRIPGLRAPNGRRFALPSVCLASEANIVVCGHASEGQYMDGAWTRSTGSTASERGPGRVHASTRVRVRRRADAGRGPC